MKAFIIPFLFLFVACQKKDLPDCGVTKNIYGQYIVWKKIPVIVNIDASVPEQYKISIAKAADTLNEAAGKQLLVIVADPGKEYVNTIIWGGYNFPSNQQQAITKYLYTVNEIYKADIYVNNSFTFYNTYDIINGVNIEALMLHELGHLLGLVHANKPSVMYPYLGDGENRIYLSYDDIKNIKCVY